MLEAMTGAAAIVFTVGISENSPEIPRLICGNLSWMGIEIEQLLNEKFVSGGEGIIGKDTARLKVYIIPTNVELLIARDAVRLIITNPKR